MDKRNYMTNVNFRRLLFFLLLILISQNGFAFQSSPANSSNQLISISGTVTDTENIPLPGVTIALKGTSDGAISDIDGNFNLEAIVGDTMDLSYIGFAAQSVAIEDGKTMYNIVMREEMEQLEEVVIVGYGVQKKETLTGSLSTVSSEELVEQPVSNISQALAGRLPGLIANQSGGRPGQDAATIKIRGIGTLDAGAGSNPLIIIDGVERDQSALTFLDPNEIENLSILKDASSTAVFGVRGANGVILVTTKRGSEGPAKMVYKASLASLIPNKSIDVLNSYEQTGLLNEYQNYAIDSDDPTAPYPQEIRERYLGVIEGNPVDPNDPYFYPSTNYADVMLRDYALQQQHNFTVSGGTEKLRYFSSLGYFDQGGMFTNINPELDKSTSYQRYNYRTNIDIDLTRSTLAKINIGGSFNESVSLGQNGAEPSRSFYWNLIRHSSPWEAYIHDDKLVMLQENANSVLLNSDMRGYNVQLQNTGDYTFVIDQKLDAITNGLSAKGTVSLITYANNVIRREKDERRLPFWSPYVNDEGGVSFYQAKEDILPFNSTGQGKRRKEYYEFALNYNRSFLKDHTITGLALFNAEKSHFSQNAWNNIPRAYLGVVGRATYNFKNRYMLEFNLGYNGSENFAEGQRFGYFPAYSAGWTFTEEPWLKNLTGNRIITYGKLRFSYGTVGNDRMRVNGSDVRFLYLPDSYSADVYNYHGWHDVGINFGLPGSTINYPIALAGQAGNANVTWEKARKVNYGLDLFILDDFTFKFDYFTEDRTDILINQRVVPIYQQTGTLALNLGQVHNEGFEFELGWNKTLNNKSRFWVDLNFSHARNTIIEMDEPAQPFEYREQTGRRVGEVWGYQQDGIFMTVEEASKYREELWETYSSLNPGADKEAYQAYQIFAAGSEVSAGDLKYIDRNGDGLINNLDAGFLDTPSFPETMFGLRTGFSHKNISLSILFQGATNYAINIRTDNNPDPSKGSVLDFVWNRYTPERFAAGEEIEFPRLTATNDNWKDVGSFWMRDASYLRLKNVKISYTFDNSSKVINRLGLNNFSVFTNGMDLLTFSSIKYLDPETTNGVLRYPRSRVVNLGVQAQF